jgi:hypothetical protein
MIGIGLSLMSVATRRFFGAGGSAAILATGSWDDAGVWDDTFAWKDS